MGLVVMNNYTYNLNLNSIVFSSPSVTIKHFTYAYSSYLDFDLKLIPFIKAYRKSSER